MSDYERFLAAKAQLDGDGGFEPVWMPEFLFEFQRHLVAWAIRKGRAAIFADCGLGKTPMQLVWAENMRRKTGRPVLILTPLAVAFQAQREAQKFGIDVAVSRDGRVAGDITLTNYERLHLFQREQYGAVVCDESSAIKAMDGQTRKQVTAFMRHIPYRLLCTATAAPNDYIELGTSSEALGYLGQMDMLARFFINDSNNSVREQRYRWAKGGTFGRVTWRFKGHAEGAFWRWVASWARAVRRPSDLGFSDDGFVLPPLLHRQHTIDATTAPEGMLFALPAMGLDEERDEARRTIAERCALVADLLADAPRAVAWCQLNKEGDALTRRITGAVQLSGSDSTDKKEEILRAFSDGQIRVLVTKPSIGAWGLNWQHCRRMTFFPSHSYEQYYQAVRRSWRFGQTQPVEVDIVTTAGSAGILQNLERKAAQADQMFTALVAHMNDALAIRRSEHFDTTMEVAAWLAS